MFDLLFAIDFNLFRFLAITRATQPLVGGLTVMKPLPSAGEGNAGR
jgi:hypothetical protein